MERACFEDLVTCVIGNQTPRVWSLLVTVFGDLAQDRDARISGHLMGRLTDCIGIKPEAMRVALHRLRKDGWIDSHRQGRTSSYVLTDWGRSQSAQASPRIYATHTDNRQAWLVLTDSGQPAARHIPGEAIVAPHIRIAPVQPETAQSLATLIPVGGPLPDWVRSKICDPDTVAQSRDLAKRLNRLRAMLRSAGTRTPLEIAALRVLIVHSWRRIVLKVPTLPDQMFPVGWDGPACRTVVAELLETLPKQNLSDL